MIHHNWVLLQVSGQYFEKVKGLYFDKSYHPEAAVNVFGIVKEAPETLLFFKKEIDAIKKEFGSSQNCPVDRLQEIQWLTRQSVQYDVPVEIKKGDTVIFKYQVYFQAFKEGRVFMDGKDMLILVPYDMLILAIRDDKFIPVNGYVLIEPIITKSEVIIEEGQEEDQLGVITHIGSPCKNYLGYEDQDDDFFKEGDTIFFKKNYTVPVEYSTFQTLDKKYYRIHRRNILATVEPSHYTPQTTPR